MAFTELGCMQEINRAVDEMGWLLPTDIQAESIPLILGGGDVLMAAETGSGKTGAFSIPVVQIIHEAKLAKGGKIPSATGGGDATGSSGTSSGIVEMNAFDRDPELALQGSLAQSRHFKNWNGCRASHGVTGNEGRYCYEVTCTDQGLSRIGFASDLNAKLNLGTCPNGFGFGGTGKKSNNYNFDDFGEAYGQHDVMGVCLDLSKSQIKYFKNGKDLGVAYSNLNTNQIWYPAIVLKNAEVDINFDNMKHKYPGFRPFSQANNLVPGKNIGSKSGNKRNFDNLKKLPMSIIIEPSRELAQQTANNIEMFSKYVDSPKISYVTLVGGTNASEQMKIINQGVDIIIATPGRLDDFITNGNLSCENIRFLVMDEADAIIKDQGNLRFIHKLHSLCPNAHPVDGKRLQIIVCSATLHNFDVKKLAEKIMKFPTWVDLKGQDSVPDTVHHIICHVKPKIDRNWEDTLGFWTDGVHKKDRTSAGTNTPEQWSESVKLLKARYTLKFLQVHKCDRGIIFCRTKLDCDNIEKFLKKKDPSLTCCCLHSDRKPHERKANLEMFKQEKVKFLICTDVAARGIDVKGIPYVINVTMPDQKENYVHRIGRVGRADRMGLAISLVAIDDNEKVWYHSNCKNRGKGCYNTNLTDQGGCCIWYNERNLLGEVEDHLGITIDTIDPDMKVPVNEFDGKVVYGEKHKRGTVSRGHVDEIAPALSELKQMERLIQGSFLDLGYRREAKLMAWK